MPKEFKPEILLLGCGYTLTRLLKRLPLGKVVYTTSSEESLAAARKIVSSRFEGRVVDITSPSSVREILDEFPTLEIIIDSIPPLSSGDALAGVKNVAAAIKDKQIKKFIYLSTTGVYGVNDGSEVNEDSMCFPIGPKGGARLEAEDVYGQATANFTSFRIAGIYGPGRGLGTSLKKGSYKRIKGKERWSNRIHVDDLVQALLLAIKFGGILPKVLCLADDTPTPISEVVAYYCEHFKLPPPQEVSEDEALKLELFTQMANQKVKNDLIKKELGLVLRYPSYKEGAETEF